MRSLGSIAAGYLIFGASGFLLFQLAGVDPHAPASAGFKVAVIVWGCVFALVAGWLTARIAGRRPATHAGILALLIAVLAVASLLASRGEAKWSQLSAAALMAPCAWAGGLLSRRSID